MSELNSQGFCEYFGELWGKQPFAWQRELARRVLEDDKPWPDAIALPTAAGKTACLDIAVYALAAQANRLAPGQPLFAPRRIFFVVDRRVIVDEAYERARQLSEKLLLAESGILKSVADCLRQLAGGGPPLACFQLRGGMYRSDAWAKSPVQPTIVASTVDQLGSRLLFRAYGRSFKAWPIQAGLVGNDSLILLDEAHCSQPFLETLQAIRKYRSWAETPLISPFHAVVMSATPPAGITDILLDTSDEPTNPKHPLGKRQLASKKASLQVADKAKGKASSAEMAKKLADEAEQLVAAWQGEMQSKSVQQELFSRQSKGAPATVLFCNRVDTARATHAFLVKKYGHRAILLTGRMRPIDKDEITSGSISLLAADISTERVLDAPLFVVATQTLEVGANLDFDLLVTECASLDALRQRFGRLNRMGRDIDARAAILVRADQAENSENDPVYGEALSNTWKWLKEESGEKQQINMGIAALKPRLDGVDPEALNSPATHAPVLLPAHLDALVQTAPEPWPTPEVALFLHGPRSGPADVQICWRADLVGEDTETWKDAVIACPPAATECLSAPFNLVRRWMTGEAFDTGVDVEGVEVNAELEADKTVIRRVVRWRGRDDVEVISKSSGLRPGDVVIIPAAQAGWEELATLGSDKPIADWGDRAYTLARDKALLRLHPEVLKQFPPCAALSSLQSFAKEGPARLAEDSDGLNVDLKMALSNLVNDSELPEGLDWLKVIAAGLMRDFKTMPHPTGGLLLRGGRRLNLHAIEADGFSDEDDPTASGNTYSLLDEHLNGVAELAGAFARDCGLNEEISASVEVSARYHDVGKADPRFQAWLKNGNPWLQRPLLAKSGNMAQGRKESEAARNRAGYPAGGRHELLSVRLLESNPEVLPVAEASRELLLHLVASHHGYCRPFAPVVDDENPLEVSLVSQGRHFVASSFTAMERLDSGVAERFWQLTRRYGWWGLAWLEALMRLADHRRSEWEEKRNA